MVELLKQRQARKDAPSDSEKLIVQSLASRVEELQAENEELRGQLPQKSSKSIEQQFKEAVKEF